MDNKSKLAAFVSTAESITGHPVEFKGESVLHDYAGMNPEAAKVIGWPDADDSIIIDKNQTEKEQISDVIHEVVEESEMKQGKNYHDAHLDALKAEETIKTPKQLVDRVMRIKKSGKAKYSVGNHKGKGSKKIHKSATGLGSIR